MIRKSSTITLQIVLVALALGVLGFMLMEPQLEGRNIGASFSQIYFHDPFLIYAYIAAIPFFMALWQSFKLLGFIRENKVFSMNSVKALQKIKYCATAIVAFVVAAEAYLAIVRPGDDIAGGVFMGLLVIFISGVVATAAGLFEKMLQSAVEIKSENDLTV